MDYIAAHRKALLTALTAVLVLFLDADVAQTIAAALGTLLVLVVPNDQAATQRVYHKHG